MNFNAPSANDMFLTDSPRFRHLALGTHTLVVLQRSDCSYLFLLLVRWIESHGCLFVDVVPRPSESCCYLFR